jgi:VIT1/CCC1 family predicted Fe2+/Mn2+ transporter
MAGDESLHGNDKLSNARLNSLRAAVLGANDGIVSVASIVVGVAGASASRGAIFTAGLAGLVAGAFSMAVGEYVSVSSQRDTERVYIAREKRRLKSHPEEEFEELVQIYENKGMSRKTARAVAQELTEHDPIRAHLESDLGLDEEDLTNPMHAAVASFAAFTVGGLIPLVAVTVASEGAHIWVTAVSVVVALMITGYLSATAGGASRRRAMLRVVGGGILAMAATYIVGALFGTAVS